ncbi:IS3 family transposase, partial [Thiotrichales bacterium 19S11-10]|nr:IS3 family transposase [Thiotrichales bacterium 19S11-10]
MIKYQRAFHSVAILCKVLGVSRSGYYAWLSRPVSMRARLDHSLTNDIERIFYNSRKTYGVPRIQRALQHEGKRHGKAKISRIMKMKALIPKAAKRFKTTTQSNHNLPVAPNMLEQDFKVKAPNKVWCSDITYIRTDQGWLYLATIIDLYSRMIIGWSMSTSLKTKIVDDALLMALWKRKPDNGCIHHSDRGTQYCSHRYRDRLKQHGLVCSMSSSGNCYDNAVMESFYHSLKVELIYDQRYK